MEGAQTISKQSRIKFIGIAARIIVLGAVLLIPIAPVYADALDDQIQALRQQSSAQQNQAASLHAQANDYRSKVNQLQAQIYGLQIQINLSQARVQKLNGQIEAAKLKIAKQKAILSDIIKTMYFDSTVSPLEMLASSDSISEFLDNEQYRQTIKTQIQGAMAEIQTLKKNLETEQAQVNQIIIDQQGQKQQLAANQAEVNNLLAVAQRDAAAADQQVRSSNSEITKLKAQQAAILAARFSSFGALTRGGTCGGGYPARWCNAAQDSLVDNWGMYNRECVSYAAFKVATTGKVMPYWGGRGHAYQWDDNARAAGIRVSGTPEVGAIAQTDAGPYGHVAYVEAVLGDKVRISQYNFDGNGTYSEQTIPSSQYRYIHF